MDYERLASDAILETCAERREDFLRNALTRARAAIATFGPRIRIHVYLHVGRARGIVETGQGAVAMQDSTQIMHR